jgi:hypothetical protein
MEVVDELYESSVVLPKLSRATSKACELSTYGNVLNSLSRLQIRLIDLRRSLLGD